MTPFIDARLRRWRLQRLRALWAEGAARLALWAGAVVLAAVAADRAAGLPRELRWALFAAGAAGLAAGAAAWLARPLRHLEAGRLLEAACERWPEARGLLRSAWELARSPLQPFTSSELAARHLEAAERAAADLPREPLFTARLAPALKRRLAGVACLWAAGLPLLGGPRALTRVVAPWLERPLEADLVVAPGDARVPWASQTEVSARWAGGGSRAPLGLELRSEGGRWTAAAWDREEPAGGAWRSESLTAPLDYRLVSRDRRSRAFRLTPVPAPRFSRLSARVRRPGGALEEVSLEGASEIASLRGSWVSVRGEPERPLDAGWLEVSSLGGPVPMRKVGGAAWEGSFPLQQDGTLIVVAEAEGRREPEPPVFQLRALEDRPPEAVILSPAFAVETSRRERLLVAYEARDDFGLSGLALLYRVDGGPERALLLDGFKAGASSHLGELSWDLSGFPDGAKVEFRLRAVDNARPEPQATLSSPGLVVLSDFEAAHAAVEQRMLGAEASLKGLAESERAMRQSLEAAEALPEAARAARQEALEVQEQLLSGEWARAEKGMSEFADAMEKDPYANPGMTESARAMAEDLKAMRAHDLEAARKAQKAGELADAAKRHGELESKVRRASELMAGGREMQAMQDFWADAHRMDQAGVELAGALEKLAKGGPPSPADKRKLDEALANLQRQMEATAKAIAALPKPPAGSPSDARRKTYTVPMGAAAQSMDALSAALARGDYAEAARQARELSRRLEAVRQAISQAAEDLAESADQSPSKRLGELEAAWKEAAAAQERALESVAAVEESRVAERTKAQEALLDRLTAEQRAAVKEGERLGRWLPPGPMPDMRAALGELEARKIREAPARLGNAVERLAAQARALSPEGAEPPQAAKDLAALAEVERSILKRLQEGARGRPMSEEQLSKSFSAEAVQKQASRKTGELGSQVEGLERDYGMSLGEAGAELEGAKAEQAAAERALAGKDTGSARGAQERALEHLRRGAESAAKEREQAQSIERSSSRPFGRRRATARPFNGKGGRTGSDTGFVPLPRVSEYQPPKLIRGEVEKSLREKRPPAFDKTVDEYLKRLSQ
ncbi:MAG: hypothetical protein HYZ75_11515 [Elusimicrobia bacterium]|nr:hypothetical protein [Elusimicrobiota bacterium]